MWSFILLEVILIKKLKNLLVLKYFLAYLGSIIFKCPFLLKIEMPSHMTQRFWRLIEAVKVSKPSTAWPLTLLHSFTCKTGDIINLPPPSHPTKKGSLGEFISVKLRISKLLTKQYTLHLYISMLAIYKHSWKGSKSLWSHCPCYHSGRFHSAFIPDPHHDWSIGTNTSAISSSTSPEMSTNSYLPLHSLQPSKISLNLR